MEGLWRSPVLVAVLDHVRSIGRPGQLRLEKRRQRNSAPLKLKSHQRKLVDGSNPFYKKSAFETVNPPNGSWWIVQILPSHSGDLEIVGKPKPDL